VQLAHWRSGIVLVVHGSRGINKKAFTPTREGLFQGMFVICRYRTRHPRSGTLRGLVRHHAVNTTTYLYLVGMSVK
jgi:hypothetical protein